MSKRRLTQQLTIGVFVLSAIGCETFVPATFNQGDGLQDATVLIVPFSELREDLWYTESRRGDALARYLDRWIRENASHDLVVDDTVIEKIRDWPSDRISRMNWRSLLADSEADYVVVGDLKNIRLQSQKMIGLLDASGTVRFRVIEAKTGKTIYSKQDLSMSIGNREEEIDIPIMAMGSDQVAVSKRVLALLGKAVGRELYGYYKD